MLGAAAAGAQVATPPPADGPALPAPLGARFITTPPTIDGRLDEGVWREGTPATAFSQFSPTPGAPASQRTEVRVLYDAHAIYVGARLFDTHPDSIATQLGRRDSDEIYSDWFSVVFDSYADKRTAFEFAVSARGVLRDLYRFNDSEEDVLWDAVWNVATRIDSLGWTAEFRIPLSQLRYDVAGRAGAARGRWGINFIREVARLGELDVWAPTSPNAPGIVSRFGDLVGLDSLRPASRLELIPYVRAQSTLSPSAQQSVFVPATAWGGAVGGDLRVKLPQSLTLTASINPDFGQVEADPAVVNLTAFEIFFPERRPFFLENADVFSFGGTTTFNDNDRPNFFYTRRVGRPPQAAPRGDAIDVFDVPRTTPILGAIKLSGTTPSGWQVGSLNALTAREFARFRTTQGVTGSAKAEPLTNYHVTRVRRLLRGGNTGVGSFIASTLRETSDSLVTARLTDRATIGGLDFEHAWRQRRYTISGLLAGSDVRGSPSAIARLQRANYRAFQRPDATHLTFDPSRTRLGGHYGAFSVAKTAGRHFVGSVTYEETSPGFESNDLGFQFRSDFRSLSTGTFWRDFTLRRLTREWESGVFATVSENFAGESVEQRTSWFGRAQFANFWEVEGMGNVSPPTMNDRLLRGGPLALRPLGWTQGLSVSTDERRRLI
ncbi:MAG: carbohydrate binding family 9 domain-containing protein, partial [Gemmatimonadaceae bacterium]|nr:carbohydrate binding family 9 domain-containing protein [Gemmatimonadaceae bacterium]